MIDCHILVSRETPRVWVEQCLDSVSDAAACAGYPVYVHIAPGVPGHLGRARAAGYALGTQPYVTYVDDDDYLLPNAFAALAPALSAKPPAIYGRMKTLQNGVFTSTSTRHVLQVHRREALIDHALWAAAGDMEQRKVPGVDILEPGYVYRLYPHSRGRALIRANRDEYLRATA